MTQGDKTMAKIWFGVLPTHCDTCKTDLALEYKDFVDGRTIQGPWANMCLSCHGKHGVGIGSGYGQKYHYNSNTKQYDKVEG
jgi:cytochrome c553